MANSALKIKHGIKANIHNIVNSKGNKNLFFVECLKTDKKGLRPMQHYVNLFSN